MATVLIDRYLANHHGVLPCYDRLRILPWGKQ